MCGLVGVAGDLGYKDTDIFKELLFLSQVRGSDATGVCAFATKTGTLEIFKRAIPSSTFVDLRRVDGMISTRSDVLMGHTRKSTSDWASKYSHDDAHPFYWNDIVGMHNGVIPSQALNKLPHDLKGAIDSEKLIYNISKEGVDKILPNVWGAWALTLLDAENKKLGFIRNKERGLAFAFSKDKKRMYWASEGPMLHWVLMRHGIETADPYPTLLPEDTFFEVALDSGKPIAEAISFNKVEGGKEPEKKITGGATGTVIPGSTFKPKTAKALTPEEAAFKAIYGLEQQLLGFDYSSRHRWSKPQRKRFEGLINALSRMYEDWNSGNIPEHAALPPPQEKEEVALSGDKLKEQLLADKGCAFCCRDSVTKDELEDCVVGATGEILCNVCGADPALRQIAQVPN